MPGMTKKQAFLAALRGERPDVVPVSPLIHARYAHKVLGRSDWRAVFEVHRMIGSTHYRGPLGVGLRTNLPDGYEFAEEVLHEDGPLRVTRTTLHAPSGALTQTVRTGMIPGDPLVSRTTEYFVKEPKDWEAFVRIWNEQADTAEPDPGAPIVEACRVMGEEGVPSVGVGSAYAMMAEQRGMAELLLDLLDEPDLMRAVAEAAWRYKERLLDSFIACPSEVCFYDICWATGSNMGPRMFEAWVGEEIRRACQKVRAVGKYISLYTLGRIRELMDGMVDAGPHMIATFEPNEGDISLAEAKNRCGRRVCLMGNFDCVVLARGSVEQARREAARCLDEAMAGGGFILGTADEVPADTRPENLLAMVQVAQEHGRY